MNNVERIAEVLDDAVTVAVVLYQGEDVPAHSRGIFTPEWVDRLYRGIKRNTTRLFRFVCFVDRDDYEFKEPIETRKLELPYRNMLSLLEPFRENFGRVVFMGLDTIITGNIDKLMDYRGPFAMLRDPYFPERPCSGVMAFPYTPSVWQAVKAAHDDGTLKHNTMFDVPSDMIFLGTQPHVLIDDYVTGIASYKVHVRDQGMPISDTCIVYFHGREKPHDLAGTEWVDRCWGPPLPLPFSSRLNTSEVKMRKNAVRNMKRRGIDWFMPAKDSYRQQNPMLIIGGGPSLASQLPHLRMRMWQRSGDIFATNGSHDYLIAHGIKPQHHVVLDSRKGNDVFVQHPDAGVRYWISATCHPAVFAALRRNAVTLWFPDMDGMLGVVRDVKDKPVVLVGGGATVGLKALCLGYLMGYRRFEMFGVDSCYADGQNHAYPQPLNDGEKTIDVRVGERTFTCAPWMAKQAYEFQYWVRKLVGLGCDMTVHGDGLLAHIMTQWKNEAMKHAS